MFKRYYYTTSCRKEITEAMKLYYSSNHLQNFLSNVEATVCLTYQFTAQLH